MKTADVKLFIAAVLLLAASVAKSRAADYKPDKYRCEIETAGVGANETFLYRVTCDIKKPQMAEQTASECAVYGVVFKGCAAAGRNPAQTPLVKAESLSEEQIAYFDNFFGSEQYLKYVVDVARNNIKIIKTKKGYRAEAVVSVSKRRLRRDLEADGIIEKLGQMFEN